MENVLIRLDEFDLKTIERAYKRLLVDKVEEIISVEELIGVISDLVDEIDELKEKISDLEYDMQENHKPIKEENPMSDCEFH